MKSFTFHIAFILLLVTSPGNAQSIEEILIQKVGEAIQTIYPGDGYRYTINTKWVPGKIQSLSGDEIVKLELNNEYPKGYEIASVAYTTRSGIQKANIQVHIELEQHVPVAASTLKKGTPIDELSVQMAWVPMTRFRGTYITDEQVLLGKAVGRLIKKGRGFQQGDLVLVPVVEPGDIVDLVYKENGINIVIPCIARQNKAIGEHIRLINKETGRTYLGTLTSKSSAIWEKTL